MIRDLNEHLRIDRCPHCQVDNPNLSTLFQEVATTADDNSNQRIWRFYKCKRCGGAVIAWAWPHDRLVRGIYPEINSVDENIPGKVNEFLRQAIECTFAPAGSVMLCASAVDEMLKLKGYTEGNLHSRINEAVKKGLLTEGMGNWAHQVRLDANNQRHADINVQLPTVDEAKQSVEFTETLAEILFVLPAKISRGLSAINSPPVKGGRGGK